MRYSQTFVPTLKETPAGLRLVIACCCGLDIYGTTAGVYTYLPFGLAAIQVERIVRGEMNRAGALELLMPMVQPADCGGRPVAEKYGRSSCVLIAMIGNLAWDRPMKR